MSLKEELITTRLLLKESTFQNMFITIILTQMLMNNHRKLEASKQPTKENTCQRGNFTMRVIGNKIE